MFDIGPFEFFIALVVALVVLGPERLPAALRTLGLWIGRLRRSYYNVKTEIEREIGMDDVRRQLHNEQVMEDVRRVEREVRAIGDDLNGATAAGSATDSSSPQPIQADTPSPDTTEPEPLTGDQQVATPETASTSTEATHRTVDEPQQVAGAPRQPSAGDREGASTA